MALGLACLFFCFLNITLGWPKKCAGLWCVRRNFTICLCCSSSFQKTISILLSAWEDHCTDKNGNFIPWVVGGWWNAKANQNKTITQTKNWWYTLRLVLWTLNPRSHIIMHSLIQEHMQELEHVQWTNRCSCLHILMCNFILISSLSRMKYR